MTTFLMDEIGNILKNAIAEGDIIRIKTEVEKNPNVATMSITDQGSTPLMVSAAYGQLEIVEYLVRDIRVDVNTPNLNGTTGLVFACNMDQTDVVQFLCENGAIVDCVIDSGDTPLTIAAAAGHRDIIACLCSHSANIEWRNGDGQTALHCACDGGHTEAVAVLLDNQANIDALTSTDMGELCCTPLVYACKHGHIDIAGQLIGRGADCKVISEGLMHTLCPETKRALTDLLTATGWMPLLDFRRACEQNDTITFRRLLGAYPSLGLYLSANPLPSAGGANAVAVASLHGSIDILRCIAEMAISRTPDDSTVIDMQVS
jgi:ankyrin repeat protein